MLVPRPLNQLEGHCSALSNGTLYVLSPQGMQSLALEKNAKWQKVEGGKSVTSPACVTAHDEGALYVVGGTSQDPSYSGLQRFLFGSHTWETLTLPGDNLKGRTEHSATYLDDAQSILVYGGSQPGEPTSASSETFLISTKSPYNLQAFSSKAPPTRQPVLEPWNTSHAVMMGGSTFNKQVWLFGPQLGWSQLITNLSLLLPVGTRGKLIPGSDGSKVMQVFHLDESPNRISQLVLLGPEGQTAPSGMIIPPASSSRKRKRGLTLEHWPAYNSTNAPTAKRADYSVAQAQNGLTAISGGNKDEPLTLFNSFDGSWVDTSKFFNVKNQQPLLPSATKPPMTSATTASPTTSAPAPSKSDSGTAGHQPMLGTLGIILGVLFGIAALFMIALLIFRWRKSKREESRRREEEKDSNRLSFADRGTSFVAGADDEPFTFTPPKASGLGSGPVGDSHSSLAIITGRITNKRSSHRAHTSTNSTAHLIRANNGQEPVEMVDMEDKGMNSPERTYDPNRSSGWSNFLKASYPESKDLESDHASVAPSTSGRSEERGRTTPQLPLVTTTSSPPKLIPPIDVDYHPTFGGQQISHVNTGSPSYSHSREDLTKLGGGSLAEAQKGLIVNGSIDGWDRRSQISGFSLSANRADGRPYTPRIQSSRGEIFSTPQTETCHNSRESESQDNHESTYSSSTYDPRERISSRGSRGFSTSFFPGSGVPYHVPKSKSAFIYDDVDSPTSAYADRSTMDLSQLTTDSGPANNPEPDDEPSNYDLDPKPLETVHPKRTNQQQAMPNDMSWINLGLGNDTNKF